MKMQKETNSKDDSKNGKKSFSKKNKEKCPSKPSQIECFNYGVKGQFASNCPTPKKNKKFIQVTQSDSESNDIECTNSTENEEIKNPIAFIASLTQFPKIQSKIQLNIAMRKKATSKTFKKYIMPCTMKAMR